MLPFLCPRTSWRVSKGTCKALQASAHRVPQIVHVERFKAFRACSPEPLRVFVCRTLPCRLPRRVVHRLNSMSSVREHALGMPAPYLIYHRSADPSHTAMGNLTLNLEQRREARVQHAGGHPAGEIRARMVPKRQTDESSARALAVSSSSARRLRHAWKPKPDLITQAPFQLSATREAPAFGSCRGRLKASAGRGR